MVTESIQQEKEVVDVLVCFLRDARKYAGLAADFLDQAGLIQDNDQGRWNPAFLIELGAVLRIREWEHSCILRSIDPTLPTYDEAFSDLVDRLRTQPDQFLRGETPLAKRVLICWWFQCAHPNKPNLQADVVLIGVSRKHLLSSVARLLWKLRDLNTISTAEGDCNER